MLGVSENGASTRELKSIFDKHEIGRKAIGYYALKLLEERDSEEGHSRKLYQLAGLRYEDLGLKKSAKENAAMKANGGIDFDRAQMQMNVRKEGQGVQMKFDPAMVARIRRDGFDGLILKLRVLSLLLIFRNSSGFNFPFPLINIDRSLLRFILIKGCICNRIMYN